jgi:chromosome segregation ATPase
MKKEIIIVGLICVLFLLVVGSIIASVSFYKEYKEKIDYLDQQAQAGKGKIEGLETKLGSFKDTVDDISSQLKTYSDNIKTIQNTITLSEDERKDLLAKIEEMKKNLLGIQKDYSSTIVDIRQGIMNLKDEIEKMGNKTRDIELGKITVKQNESKVVPQEMPKENKQAAAPAIKSGGSNFKSGNVRKIGGF